MHYQQFNADGGCWHLPAILECQFDPIGHDSNGDNVPDTNGGWLMMALTLMN